MQSYTVNGHNYRLLQTRQTKAPFSVQFQWGKFDFFFHFKKVEDLPASTESSPSHLLYTNEKHQKFVPSLLQLLFQNEPFDFVKPTAHGLSLEETQWKREEKLHYMELPKDLFAVATQFCAEHLELTPASS